MTNILRLGHRGSIEYNFTTNFIWRDVFLLRAAEYQGHLIIQSDPDDPTYIFPSGSGDVKPVIDALILDAHAKGIPLTFNVVLNEDIKRLEALYPGQFIYTPNRNDFDYVYTSDSLITLAGRKLSSKRNHINRFIQQYPDWQYEPITKQNISEAHEMSQAWCLENSYRENETLYMESYAVEQAFRHYFDLNLTGALLRIRGKVIAVTMGEALNDTTYVIHIEKALNGFQGAYQMINREFAAANCSEYQYINREDDAGDEGLRRAKLSYRPAMLIEKSSAVYIGEGTL